MYDEHLFTAMDSPFTLNADRVTYHKERAIWCVFKAWQYYLKDDLEVSIAFEQDAHDHLTRMFYEQQKIKRGAVS